MSEYISKQALHNKIFERMEAEVLQSRVSLGGYHTGKRDAYLNVISDLKEASSDQGEVQLWTCPDCGFGFDAIHGDEKGGYSCPNCSEAELLKEVQRLRSALSEILEHYDLATVVKEIAENSLSPQPEKGEPNDE